MDTIFDCDIGTPFDIDQYDLLQSIDRSSGPLVSRHPQIEYLATQNARTLWVTF
ncbi:unnamed protein product [marine sediment metagenome]|uniref:Uncharacterized protein n=1 Tax=marine sediment metagenome TaxID=412755 RepID=X1DAM1_9ZZZZ